MRIAVIGAGQVGRALGRRLTEAAHTVIYGVRDPDHAEVRPAMSPAEAAARSDIILLATPFAASADALAACGDLSGKIVIDATNPLTMGDHGLELSMGHDVSGAETLAEAVPGARLYKAFNQTGAENLGDAGRYARRPVMFVAGDETTGKRVVMGVVEDAGFEAVDAGLLRAARLLEPLAGLWIQLAINLDDGRDFAFARIVPER